MATKRTRVTDHRLVVALLYEQNIVQTVHLGAVAVDPDNAVARPHRKELPVTGIGAAQHLHPKRSRNAMMKVFA